MEEPKPLIGQYVSIMISGDGLPYTGVLEFRKNEYVLTNATERGFFGVRLGRVDDIKLPKGTKVRDPEGNIIYTI